MFVSFSLSQASVLLFVMSIRAAVGTSCTVCTHVVTSWKTEEDVFYAAVFQIRSESGSTGSTCFFLGLPDPDPSTVSASKNSKKTLDSYCFVTFIVEKGCKCSFKSNEQKNFF
jgi:hypothetical protein